jgi:hypothetical protein
VDPAVWKQQRLAYNVERRTLVAQCHSLVEFLLDFDCVWEKRPMSVTNVWVNTSLRWKDIPITTGNVPKYRFQGPNQPAREYELDTDPQKIRELAKSDAARTSLWDATVAHLKGVTMDSLLQSFEDDVRPYLLMRFGESETNRKLDFYFGSGDRIGFLRVLADPSVTAASMAAV